MSAEQRRISLSARRIEAERGRMVAEGLYCDERLREEEARAAAELDNAALADSTRAVREQARKSLNWRRVELERKRLIDEGETIHVRAKLDTARADRADDRTALDEAHRAEAAAKRKSIAMRAEQLKEGRRLDEANARAARDATQEARALAALDREARDVAALYESLDMSPDNVDLI